MKIIFFIIIFGQGRAVKLYFIVASLPGSHIFGGLLKIRIIKKNDIMKRENFDIKFIRHK